MEKTSWFWRYSILWFHLESDQLIFCNTASIGIPIRSVLLFWLCVYETICNNIYIMFQFHYLLFNALSYHKIFSSGCPRRNIPLGEGRTSSRGTFFLGYLVDLIKTNVAVIKYTAPNHSISKRIHRNVLKIVTYNEHPLASQLSDSLQQYWWPHRSKLRHHVCWQCQLLAELHGRFPINGRWVSYLYPINQLLELDTICTKINSKNEDTI